MKRLFITATDTGAGKTTMACALLKLFNAQSWSTLALKPVASGAYAGQSIDALSLMHFSSLKLPYAHVNPYVFLQPIAPHIAAAQEGVCLNVAKLKQACEVALSYSDEPDVLLIEGAGGCLCPLNQDETLLDFAKAMACEVVLVVAMKLGCLNHAMLSYEAIKARGLNLFCVVLNNLDPAMAALEENKLFLRQYFSGIKVIEARGESSQASS